MSIQRRHLLLAAPWAAWAGPARAVRRSVETPALSLELPDHWLPIPRAEILEAEARAREAGADAAWSVRAAWQPPPHLRWFAIPHLVLQARAAPGEADAPPQVAPAEAGRAGARTLHSHRATWTRDGLALRLVLLTFEPEQDAFFREVVGSLVQG